MVTSIGRSERRIYFELDAEGFSIVSPINLARFVEEIESRLATEGYEKRPYDECATAYAKEDVPFREEPILIDNLSWTDEGPDGEPKKGLAIILRRNRHCPPQLIITLDTCIKNAGLNVEDLGGCEEVAEKYGFLTDEYF